MRIGDVRQASSGPAAAADGALTPVASESRALIALQPPAPAAAVPANYRQANFLAHLLAAKDRHAQARERRRAAPDEALAAYRATAGLVR